MDGLSCMISPNIFLRLHKYFARLAILDIFVMLPLSFWFIDKEVASRGTWYGSLALRRPGRSREIIAKPSFMAIFCNIIITLSTSY